MPPPSNKKKVTKVKKLTIKRFTPEYSGTIYALYSMVAIPSATTYALFSTAFADGVRAPHSFAPKVKEISDKVLQSITAFSYQVPFFTFLFLIPYFIFLIGYWILDIHYWLFFFSPSATLYRGHTALWSTSGSGPNPIVIFPRSLGVENDAMEREPVREQMLFRTTIFFRTERLVWLLSYEG